MSKTLSPSGIRPVVVRGRLMLEVHGAALFSTLREALCAWSAVDAHRLDLAAHDDASDASDGGNGHGSHGDDDSTQRLPRTVDTSVAVVLRWYDSRTRSHVVQLKDRNGDQLGAADYVGTRDGADQLVREYAQRHGLTLSDAGAVRVGTAAIDTPKTARMLEFLTREVAAGRVTGLSIEDGGAYVAIYTDSSQWCDDAGSGTFSGASESQAIANYRERVRARDVAALLRHEAQAVRS